MPTDTLIEEDAPADQQMTTDLADLALGLTESQQLRKGMVKLVLSPVAMAVHQSSRESHQRWIRTIEEKYPEIDLADCPAPGPDHWSSMVPVDLDSAMAAARVRRAANPSAVLRLFEEDEELATMKMIGDESYTETDYDETDYDEEEEEEEEEEEDEDSEEEEEEEEEEDLDLEEVE